MKYVVALCIFGNLVLAAYGAGYFGLAPSERGRSLSPMTLTTKPTVIRTDSASTP